MNITRSIPPWSSGPAEILKHALDLLQQDSDTNRRLAMISIDNSVELMIRTYLGLPGSVTGLAITHKEYEEFENSFPKLLDALNTYARDRINGIDLTHINWYHRLRNTLYHEGNGLTIEKEKVTIYSELAHQLFTSLFGFRIDTSKDKENELLAEFMQASTEVNRIYFHALFLLDFIDKFGERISNEELLRKIFEKDIISNKDLKESIDLLNIRDDIIHNRTDYKKLLNKKTINELYKFAEKMDEWFDKYFELVN